MLLSLSLFIATANGLRRLFRDTPPLAPTMAVHIYIHTK